MGNSFARRIRGRAGIQNGTLRVSRLVTAYRLEDMELHFQPIVDIGGGGLAGLEALVRWQDPVNGFLAARDFIHGLSATELRDQLGGWVLGRACSTACAWRERGLEPPPIAVNFSTFEANELPLYETVTQTLADTGLAPELLDLEIHGGALVADAPMLWNKLRAIHGLGVGLTIDLSDYDTSGLSRAREVGVTGVKLDVSAAATSAPHRIKAEALVREARALDLIVTAKRAETITDLQLVQELGCDHVQGYAFGEPLAAERTEELLSKVARGADRSESEPAAGGEGSRQSKRSLLLVRAERAVRIPSGSDDAEVIEAMLVDLSETGMQLRVAAPVEVGDAVRVQLSAGADREPVEVRGAVVAVERLSGDTYRVNARLVDSSDAVQRIIAGHSARSDAEGAQADTPAA